GSTRKLQAHRILPSFVPAVANRPTPHDADFTIVDGYVGSWGHLEVNTDFDTTPGNIFQVRRANLLFSVRVFPEKPQFPGHGMPRFLSLIGLANLVGHSQ